MVKNNRQVTHHDFSNIKILSVNISEKTGISKHPVDAITLTNLGVDHDAHAGAWNRQVSLLGTESIRKFEKETGKRVSPGEFAENITTEGSELWKMSPLDRLICGEAELEVTQIGKECHGTSCVIFKEVGNCVMPKEGIFCRVIHPGVIQAGDIIEYHPKVFSVMIITLSDRASRGEYEDKSGPRIKELVEDFLNAHTPLLTSHLQPVTRDALRVTRKNLHQSPPFTIHYSLIPDDPSQLKVLLEQAKQDKIDLIFTTGGTGIGPKDITPEVVRPMLDKEIPGIMEMIRLKYGEKNPNALVSRSIAGVMGESLVFTLPGSVKAVDEYMEVILPLVPHLVLMLHGIDQH
jgi:molybdenum cofactor synthesis domain-containing protein